MQLIYSFWQWVSLYHANIGNLKKGMPLNKILLKSDDADAGFFVQTDWSYTDALRKLWK